jgi:alanine racemase
MLIRGGMRSRAWMLVDLGALVHNATALAERAGVPLIPMVKADAYGLGAVEVTKALEKLSPLAYGVATVEEGRELRNAGITRDIIVFTPLLPDDFSGARELELTPSLGSANEIEAWKIYGSPYYLSIDTGMHRAGLPWREVATVAPLLKSFPPIGAYTHFHSAELDDDTMSEQVERFEAALQLLPAIPAILHTDNSAAIVRHDRSTRSAIRPGIFMYGVGSGEAAALDPRPVVHLQTRIVEIRTVEKGDTVSYDATWMAERKSRIATIPLGYADGYPRNASSGGYGVVRDEAVKIAGRVTMDMTMLDVTDVPAEIGDVVTMIGNAAYSEAPIDVASVARLADMSPYELLTGLRSRIERIYTIEEDE